MLPGFDGFETCRRLREAGDLDAGADADRPRLGRGPRRRARHRRRRLPGQAVRVRGAARSAARAARRGDAERPIVLEVGDLRLDPATREVSARRYASRADREGVRAARARSCDWPGTCSRGTTCSRTPGTSPTRAVRTWSTCSCGGCAPRSTSRSAGAVRDGPWRGLPAAGRRWSVRRAPIRVRVAAAFAAAMALVLAATSWFLYARLNSHLALALDRGLRLRSQDLAALVEDPPARSIVLSEARLASLRAARATRSSSTRAACSRPRRPRAAGPCSAPHGSPPRPGVRRSTQPQPRYRGSTSRWLLAPPVRRGGAVVLVVGVTQRDRSRRPWPASATSS